MTSSISNPDEGFSRINAILESQKARLIIKRVFDILASFIGLLVLLVLLICVYIAVKIGSPGPAFFKQIRVGKYGREFYILKFRTMIVNAEDSGQLITVGDDLRITRIGRLLRRTKIDELPQIINVLKGDMSFVGPRPEVPKYVNLYSDAQRQILLIRPGITDVASIKFRNESEILAGSVDPEKMYIEEVVPTKLKYNLEYINNISVINDIRLILKTLLKY